MHFPLRGGYGEFWIFYNFQAYFTKFADCYCFVIIWNLWNFQGILWIIFWYNQILNKKSIKVKKFPAHYIFCDWAKNWHRSSEAFHLKIGLPDFSNLIEKYFFHIIILKKFFCFIYHLYFDAILVPYGSSEIWYANFEIMCFWRSVPIFSTIPKTLMRRKFFEYWKSKFLGTIIFMPVK